MALSFGERTPAQKAALLRLHGAARESFLELSSAQQEITYTRSTPTQKADQLGLGGAQRAAFLELSSADQERYSGPDVVNPQLSPSLAASFPGDPMSLLSRIGGGIRGALTGGLVGAVSGVLTSSGPRRPSTAVRPFSAPPPCPQGTRRGPFNTCLDVELGGATSGGGFVISQGEAVMARYGAALAPARQSVEVRRCPRGAVLANDGYCYNRSSLNRRDRMWVPARKPLLTGGDLNAISRAHRAATKIQAQTKRLQKMGMLAKPAKRSRAPIHRGHGQPITVIDT